ncbi:hypothetical protein SAMN06296386_10124 [Lachnospiraceae bacterium]|nr:hypothetical protein SAMN06296386_10124 [Lachnospiraceae bacterium]
MMDEYKNDLDNIHVSEELINKTLLRIEEEKKKAGSEEVKETEKPVKKMDSRKIIKFTTFAMASAAAVLIFVNTNMMDTSHLTITEVDQVEVRSGDIPGLFTENNENSVLTEAEFTARIGINGRELIKSAGFEKCSIEEDKGTFYFGNDDMEVSLSLSDSEDLTPESMKEIEKNQIDGHEVTLAKDDNNFYATGEENGVSYFLTAKCSGSKAFLKLLKEYLKNF